ncbi:hypothetical protein ACIPY2_05980 [Paenarthrobacter sp. NPDC089675]|uniref:hypothetical protein n=1 Tax=Paenarthrobacter sp. NPDC089675 TaxID=3364376 RepID=UPI0037F1CCCE
MAVESPTAPRLLDILETAGVRAIPVPWEGSGPSIERLGTAVRRGAKLFIYQPTLQVPTGRTVSEEWVANAAAVLTTNNVLAVEVEASLFASARASTLVDIAGFRESVVHIEDHSLAYGNDLRIATLTASNRVAKLVAKGLTLSERWVPPTMQLQLANHLTDSRSLYSVELAAREYERRNTAVVETLRAGGVTVESSGGMKAWLAVHDEDQSIKAIELSRLGLAHFHRGSAFKLLQGRQQHLSLHTADLLKHTEALADVLRETNDAGIARSSAMRNSQTANSRGERQAGELRVNERLA